MSSSQTDLEQLILKLLPDSTDVNLSFTEAVSGSEHYFSTLHRANISYFCKSDDRYKVTSLIVKAYPEGAVSSFMKESGAMIREINVYKSVIPKQNEVCGRKLAPIFYDTGSDDVCVMEDLKFKGYVMEDRTRQLDFVHCKSAIEILADFHASSLIIHKSNPLLIEAIGKEILYTKDNFYMKSFTQQSFKTLGNEVENWPESSKHAEKLKNCGEKIWEMVVEAVKPMTGEITVLNHGDFWTNNILFLHNERGGVEKVKLIDFQFCRWSSPAFDLHSFFIRSVRNRKDIPALIEVYLNRFNAFLRSHQIKMTVEQLDDDLRRLNCYGLIATVCLLPTSLRSRDQPIDYKNDKRENCENFESDNNPYVYAFKETNYRKIVPGLLDSFNEEGIQ